MFMQVDLGRFFKIKKDKSGTKKRQNRKKLRLRLFISIKFRNFARELKKQPVFR